MNHSEEVQWAISIGIACPVFNLRALSKNNDFSDISERRTRIVYGKQADAQPPKNKRLKINKQKLGALRNEIKKLLNSGLNENIEIYNSLEKVDGMLNIYVNGSETTYLRVKCILFEIRKELKKPYIRKKDRILQMKKRGMGRNQIASALQASISYVDHVLLAGRNGNGI